MAAIDEAKELWLGIYDKFELQYRHVYLKEEGGVKTKAHIDHCVDLTGNSIIHEPQMKWCLILFIDAMVHIATNSVFNAKALSCVGRRQFNQHKALRQSIHEMQGAIDIDVDDGDIAGAELDDDLTGEMDVPVQSAKSVATVTPELFERDLAAPILSKKRDNTNLDNDADLGDHTDSDDEVDLSLLNKRHAAARDAVQYPRNPPVKTSKKKSDKKSYRAWLDTWGSFTQLENHIGDFSAGGKSSSRHIAIARSLVHQLAFIPASTLNPSPTESSINVVSDANAETVSPYATWTEVFDYVLSHPGQLAPVSTRAARKSVASRRRLKGATNSVPASIILEKEEPGIHSSSSSAASSATGMTMKSHVITDDFFDGFSHAYVADAAFGYSSDAMSSHQWGASLISLEAANVGTHGGATAEPPAMGSVDEFPFFDALCDEDFDINLVQFCFDRNPSNPECSV